MPIEIRQEATYQERAERLHEVREPYREFRAQAENDLALLHRDGRLAFLRNVSQMARSAIVFLLFFHRSATDTQLGMVLFGITPPSRDRLSHDLRDAAKFVKLSWCVQFQFQIETLFKNLLKAVGSSALKPETGYWRVAREIVQLFEVPDPEQSHRLMNVIAHIRNSQHANGIHHGFKGSDAIVDAGGVLFEFRDQQPVQCATWDHIAHAWLSLLPIMKHIYYHPRVRDLTDPIPDRFWL